VFKKRRDERKEAKKKLHSTAEMPRECDEMCVCVCVCEAEQKHTLN